MTLPKHILDAAISRPAFLRGAAWYRREVARQERTLGNHLTADWHDRKATELERQL